MRVPLPASLRDHVANRTAEPVRPVNAATVVLLRDGADGVEAYFLRRQRSMAFAAGMYVFPGGRVDPRDADADVRWVGPPAAAWAERFGCDEGLARALVCAAVRETYEESAVLLAGDESQVVADVTGDEWEADRQALVGHELSLAALLERRGLAVRADLLAAWTHWITPEFEPRRFDTRFFVAVLPAGQRTRDVSTEADRVEWLSLSDALRREGRDEIAMMPPTWVTCRDLAALGSAAEALSVAPARRIVPVEPRLVDDDGEYFLETELP
ncbi:NUDIX hydrolase [Solicola gregarius]|uniref:NUDIX hydrolase n=1 Tax=Solicola gregarius TaxID=2908642 RepID=A0AA46TMB0_9ACTN|nr:NUDIX hydrolase [Solicola gregarius]UYM07758.1 NUDIX hydrolase [Solicola gregarius]